MDRQVEGDAGAGPAGGQVPGQRRVGGVDPGAVERLVESGLDRRPLGRAADLHDAAHGLQHQVRAGPVAVGAAMPEAGDERDHRARVPAQQDLGRQLGFTGGGGAERDDRDVGPPHQIGELRATAGVGHVQLDAPLTPVEVLEQDAAPDPVDRIGERRARRASGPPPRAARSSARPRRGRRAAARRRVRRCPRRSQGRARRRARCRGAVVMTPAARAPGSARATAGGRRGPPDPPV